MQLRPGHAGFTLHADGKLSSYRHCDKNWLLIHSGDHTMAASMTLHPYAAEEVYTTAFDRIYVLDFSGNVHQLRTLLIGRPGGSTPVAAAPPGPGAPAG